MNTKTTFHLLTVFMFVSNLYSQFDAPVYWTRITQRVAFQSQNFIRFYQYISYLKEVSINIDSSPIKGVCLVKTIQPSMHLTNIKCKFCHLQSPTF